MKLHLSRDADISIENYYAAKQERVTLTGIVTFKGVCHIILHYTNVCHMQYSDEKSATVIVIYLTK